MKRILTLCVFIVLLSHSSYAEEKRVHMSESRHFGVMWSDELNETLEKDYPQKISDEFEKAWAFFTYLGFKQPIYTSRISTLDPIELYPKILITLRKNIPEVVSPSSVGIHNYDILMFTFWSNAFEIEIPLNLSEEQIQRAAALAVFHCIQYSYDEKEDLWLYEATAHWAASFYSKKFADQDIHAMNSYLNDFTCYPLDTAREGRELFFHYLEEETTSQKNIIERIWFYASETKGPNSTEALAKALKLKDTYTDFSIANALIDHKIFFHHKDLRDKLKKPTPLDLNKVYSEKFKDEAFALTIDVNAYPSLHSVYLMITPPPTLKEKEKLYIKIDPQALEEWSVAALIETKNSKEQKILASHGKASEKIEIKNNAFFLTLDDFGPRGSEKVILILNHFSPPQKNQDTETVAPPTVSATFSIGDPPVLSSVHLVQDGKDIYKTELGEKGAEKRELLITKDEILDLKKRGGLGEFVLKFSKKLHLAPAVSLGDFKIENFKSQDAGHTWQAAVNLTELKKSLKEPWPSQLNLIVSAKSSALLSLDPIPQTVAKINDEFAKTEGEEIKILWENYEKDEKERKDKIHFIRLSSGIVLRGKVLETTSNKPIAGATVLGFVDYWETPSELIQKKKEIYKKLGEASKQKNQQELFSLFKQMYELDLSLKADGKRFTGGDPAWKATTDSEGNFEIKGLQPYKPQSMYDIMYEVLAFKKGYIFNATGSALGLGSVQGQASKLEFSLYLDPRTSSDFPCTLAIQNFSGQNFSYPVKVGQEINSWLIKTRVDQDEIVLLKDFPIDQEYNYDGSKEKNQKLFTSKLANLAAQFPGVHFIGAHPQSKKIKIPLDNKNSYEEDRFTGYNFSSAVNQYLLVQETCSLPIQSPPHQLETEPYYGSIREVFPPFIKTKDYFKQTEENLENMSKMPQK